MKTLSDYVAIYRKQLGENNIQEAYRGLLNYMMRLKAVFSKQLSGKFAVGNVSPGYMDFTYFPFFNDFLREEKLRFGIVLNHEKMRFELWLMGQNAETQKKYWEMLKTGKWNKHRSTMPKYAVLEAVLVENPTFDALDKLTEEIETEAIRISTEIIEHIKKLRLTI